MSAQQVDRIRRIGVLMGVVDDPEGQCAYPNFFRSRHTLQNALALSSYAVICTSKSNSTTPVPHANRASKWGDKEPPTIIISDRIRRAISITFQIRRDLCELEQHYQIPLPLAGSTRCWLSDAYNSGRVHGRCDAWGQPATFTTELSNIDSRTSTGAQHRFKTPFDNCAFAGQRTVLQHIPPRRTESRHVGTSRGVLPPFAAELQSQDRKHPKFKPHRSFWSP